MRQLHLFKLALFCVALVTARMIKTGQPTFIFLFWNLFLAVLPYCFVVLYAKTNIRWQKVCLVIGSVLFLPNAPYMLTDLFHLHNNMAAPMWYDLVLISGFAFLGVIIFVLTTARLFEILELYVKNRFFLMEIKTGLFLSNGYGIYLGRYLRFNSWDVLSKPNELLRSMFHSVFSTSEFFETLGMTITFTIFLYLIFGIYQSLHHHGAQQPQKLP